MGIDIKELRKENGGDPDRVRESCKKRGQDVALVDRVLELDEKWKNAEFAVNRANQEKNTINKEIGNRKKLNKEDPCTDLLEKKNELDAKCDQLKIEVETALEQRDNLLKTIGNIVHESVFVSNNEDNNPVVKTWGQINKKEITQKPGACYHHQILYMIDGYDPKAGSKVAGRRGYYMKNYGFLLCQALQSYAMKFLIDRGYDAIQPPFFMKQEIMAETCQLSDFDEQLYKVIGKVGVIGGNQEEDQKKEEQKKDEANKQPNANKEDREYYLIATSEQPISALHRKEWLDFKEGEMFKYAGFSTCFRKEAGSYGKETWGTFRVHQFEKVEQFVICRPEDSWAQHEKMTQYAQEFLESLELPYRVVSIVSGALNDAAAKKYDIEAWFPGYDNYKELMSISNCTDYQSRALEIRCGFQQKNKTNEKNEQKQYVHMLNGTLCAVQRTLCCILENYQTEEGVRVPKVLQPYLGGVELIKYKKGVPKVGDME